MILEVLKRGSLFQRSGNPKTVFFVTSGFGGVVASPDADWHVLLDFIEQIELAADLGGMRAVALNPNSHLAWLLRGWVYRVAGLPEEAVRSFERAMRVSPVDPLLHRAFTGIGFALIELGRFDEAIVAGKKAQRQNPYFSATHRCLVAALAHLGRDSEAREAAARLLEVDPGFTISAWIDRGGQSNAKLLIEGLRKAGLPE